MKFEQVKFTKKQLYALAQIEVKANAFFDEDLRALRRSENERTQVVAFYTKAILDCVIRDGVIYGV